MAKLTIVVDENKMENFLGEVKEEVEKLTIKDIEPEIEGNSCVFTDRLVEVFKIIEEIPEVNVNYMSLLYSSDDIAEPTKQ